MFLIWWPFSTVELCQWIELNQNSVNIGYHSVKLSDLHLHYPIFNSSISLFKSLENTPKEKQYARVCRIWNISSFWNWFQMNFFIGLLASIAVAQAAPYTGHYSYPAATTLVRAPEHDSAFVRSDRFGGNFAYSIAQRHAYQVFTPNTVALYVKIIKKIHSILRHFHTNQFSEPWSIWLFTSPIQSISIRSECSCSWSSLLHSTSV